MSKAILIKVKEKEKKTPNAIRREGFVPATVYGHSFSSVSVQVNAKDFSKIPHKAYSHINELEIEGKDKLKVIIRNVQKDPVRDTLLNVEFYRINEKEKIKVKVPLNFIGHSEAITKGGILIVSHDEIEIQCLPKDIPDAIDVNLDEIKEIGQAIHAGDLKVSDAIKILNNKHDILVKVETPKTHEVETPQAAATAATAAAPTAEAGKVEAAKADPKDTKPAAKK